MKRTYPHQKAALTRAIKRTRETGDPRYVEQECIRVLEEWRGAAWPDDWSRWDRALWDARGRYAGIDQLYSALYH